MFVCGRGRGRETAEGGQGKVGERGKKQRSKVDMRRRERGKESE